MYHHVFQGTAQAAGATRKMRTIQPLVRESWNAPSSASRQWSIPRRECWAERISRSRAEEAGPKEVEQLGSWCGWPVVVVLVPASCNRREQSWARSSSNHWHESPMSGREWHWHLTQSPRRRLSAILVGTGLGASGVSQSPKATPVAKAWSAKDVGYSVPTASVLQQIRQVQLHGFRGGGHQEVLELLLASTLGEARAHSRTERVVPSEAGSGLRVRAHRSGSTDKSQSFSALSIFSMVLHYV